jgi:hypothetical protein
VTGGTTHGWCTVHRPTVPPAGVPGLPQRDAQRVAAAGPALRDRVPRPHGGMADGGATADGAPVYRRQKLPPPDTGRPALVHPGLPQNLRPPGGARALLRPGPGPSRGSMSCCRCGARRGVSEADAATGVTPQAEEATPVAPTPATAPASPLVPMTGRSGASSAPKMLLHRLHGRAASKRITRSKLFGSSMPCSRCSF